MKRRKPKRKRRIDVTEKSEEKFAYAKYRVHWYDIASDSGWATESEFDRMELATPISEGWLYDKDECVIKLFSSYDKDDDEIVFGERAVIPISCIKKMKKLK